MNELRKYGESLARPSIRIKHDGSSTCNSDSCTHSRFGGKPLVPKVPAHHIRCEPETSYPDSELDELPDAEYEAIDAYSDFLDEAYNDMPYHRLLGWPQLIQNDWRLECQLASHGIYVGDPSGYQSAEGQRLAAGAGDWQLLLQIDTDDDLDIMWGDCGRIYFCITKQALETRDFDSVWLTLQCS